MLRPLFALRLKREHWRTATPIRAIFKRAFAAAGLPYFNPHSIRNTLVALAETRCKTPEEFKAWSQNLGHEGVMTTFVSYGAVQSSRQAEIIRELAKPADSQVPFAEEVGRPRGVGRRITSMDTRRQCTATARSF